ncbi:hypothetical protein CEXT_550631 [Caerostris extrusa]|uniref:Cadherin domain-containing protein n=1 Tax=Caerostris extrusa TaxID=172846 RepID=A0AAV4YCJ0_CAEEX|nr:hypothetical protein CEXT_550631 [Caerostris extrusa]
MPPLSSSATIVVTISDVNDNEPIFDQSFYNVSVAENENVGTCFLKASRAVHLVTLPPAPPSYIQIYYFKRKYENASTARSYKWSLEFLSDSDGWLFYLVNPKLD